MSTAPTPDAHTADAHTADTADRNHRLYLIHDHHPDEAFHRERFAGLLARVEGLKVVGESPAPGTDSGAGASAGFGGADVVLVLVGEHTWRSAAVDAEIARAVARATTEGLGLMGLVLRCYDYPALSARGPFGETDLFPTEPRGQSWWLRNVPQRLHDQVACGFAQMRPHPDPGVSPRDWIHEAALNGAKAALADAKVKPAPARPVATADADAEAVGWEGPAAHRPIVDAGAIKVGT